MVTSSAIIALIFVGFFLAVLLTHNTVLRKLTLARSQSELLRQAKTQFFWQRESLEARFVSYALARMDSNLWIWDDAEFGNDVLIACSRKDGIIYAYIPVVVEMNRPIRRLDQPRNELYFRQLTVIAKFLPVADRWEITGRAFFNQLPPEVVQDRAQELQYVDSIGTRAA
ncbi:MAG: hypothetical protein FWD31_04950 [Planctomycetaceae bacterium]|nr:hypothetical protein [Planctomycetaceae bacterium]